MYFSLNTNTQIFAPSCSVAVLNAINILRRDINNSLGAAENNFIRLKTSKMPKPESYIIDVGEELSIFAEDDLGFIYALLFISKEFIGIEPFWFWLDCPFPKKDFTKIPYGTYISKPADIRFRGWFLNDEVLLMNWRADSDNETVWRMAFEALLRCGGNIVIPGTDKMAKKNAALAAEMGLWITHHHAEPLGAEMFSRAYPGKIASFEEYPELFYKLWEDAVTAQKNYNVVWNLCFRGQGDKPFWSDDKSGKYNTPQKKGELISQVISKQCEIVKKHVKNPIFCTNLYGELMELYKQGHIQLDPQIIKVYADNGYGKMVTRRRDSHDLRVPSMPKKGAGRQGIYYHISFYDLQAANHITMFPNTTEFANRELSLVLENDGRDFWIINCSNIRPHTFFLDFIRKKWTDTKTDSSAHCAEYVNTYYSNSAFVQKCFNEYPKALIQYAPYEDAFCGEQFYTENSRLIANSIIRSGNAPCEQLDWFDNSETLLEQVIKIKELCQKGLPKLSSYLQLCSENEACPLFCATVLLWAKIHYFCANGLFKTCMSAEKYLRGDYETAFVLAGDSAEYFDKANSALRSSEYGKWQGFYQNDCLADIKHSAYMARKLMGYIREIGDNPSHYSWYRKFVYAPQDRDIYLLLVTDSHYTDEELYKVMKLKTNKKD